MTREGSPFRPLDHAQIEWREQAPVSQSFDDVYYSAGNGLGESTYTFLEGNRLAQRLAAHPHPLFCIGETGFGSGLNFLLSWRCRRESAGDGPQLHYISVEQHPLAPADLERALDNWPELAPYARELLAQYPLPLPGCHRLLFDGGAVRLDLYWGEAGDILQDLAAQGATRVDAWYLDGFAPAKNAAMWDPALLRHAAQLSRDGATVATFTAAGTVRRALQDAGFDVRKVAGYGRKRDALRATIRAPHDRACAVDATPWDIPAAPPLPPDSALVVGAGLAGCFTADALARRGVQVTVIDQGQVAGCASGNDQGILYTRLSRRHSTLTDFALHSFCYATRLYSGMFARGQLREGLDGALCGNFQQVDDNDEDSDDMAAIAEALAAVPELAQVLDAARASARLGIEQESAGYWFPRSGWLNPPAVCRALLRHDNIRLMENCGQVKLHKVPAGWLAHSATEELASARCAIVACGIAPGLDNPAQQHLAWLPLRAIRGQTTQVPGIPALWGLRAALCHEGYIAPIRDGQHTIGATFALDDDDGQPRDKEHRENLDRLAHALPQLGAELGALETAELQGRVGFRCASPDYLPLAGPVPDLEAFCSTYAGLRRNARKPIEARAPCIEGLYLNTAHGSRGLTSAPLAGELVAATACAEPLPLERGLSRALSPARFLARDLARGRR